MRRFVNWVPWASRLVNLFEVLDPRDVFGKTTGMKPENYYNARLARGWTLGLAQELKLLQALIRLSHKSLTAQLQHHWQKTQPDMVVSLVPVIFGSHGSKAMRRIAKRLDDTQLILVCGHNGALADDLLQIGR